MGLAFRRKWPSHGHVDDGKRFGAMSSAKRERKPRVASKVKQPRQNRNWFGGPPEPKEATAPREVLPPPDCKPVTLMDRTSHQCGWVLGETTGPDTLMCGAPKEFEAAYCAYHARIAVVTSSGERPRQSYLMRKLIGITADKLANSMRIEDEAA
jgi:hypothetical protein